MDRALADNESDQPLPDLGKMADRVTRRIGVHRQYG